MDGYYNINLSNRGRQSHNHEFLGSGDIANKESNPHNHRLAGVTGEAIPIPSGGHIHRIEANTDFYENHFNMVVGETGPGISVGNGKHVHFIEGATTEQDGHRHRAMFATLIDNPIEFKR